MLTDMGMQVSFGFGNFRLILRAPEAHATGGGTYEGQLTEAVVKNSQGAVVGRRVFRDVLDLVAQLCPGVTPAEASTQAPGGIPAPEDK
jgi:hypothetical protein